MGRPPLREAVHLTVDVNLSLHKMDIKAYTGYTIHKVNGREVLARYEQAILELHATSAEKIGVDALINGEPDNDKLDAPAKILSDDYNLYKSMTKLVEMISKVQTYCQQAYLKKDGLKGDPEIGRKILDAMAAIPNYDNPQDLAEVFNENLDDLLMVTWVAKFTRTNTLLL